MRFKSWKSDLPVFIGISLVYFVWGCEKILGKRIGKKIDYFISYKLLK